MQRGAYPSIRSLKGFIILGGGGATGVASFNPGADREDEAIIEVLTRSKG